MKTILRGMGLQLLASLLSKMAAALSSLTKSTPSQDDENPS